MQRQPLWIAMWILAVCGASSLEAQSYFRRGDSNEDGFVNLADVISVLYGVFQAPPPCIEAADINADSELDVSDAIQLIEFIFVGGDSPACPTTHHYGRGGNQPPPCPGPSPCHPTIVFHEGAIDQSQTWGPDVTHRIEGWVTVEPGVELSLLPGTTILGGDGAALIVRPEGKLFAMGTARRPVTFTSPKPCPDRGDWGGVYLLGAAETNMIDPFLAEIGEEFGGGDPSDCSGVMSHVRVEYAGQHSFGFIPGGLNLFGVGDETDIDNILIKESGGDGLRVGGGTVRLRNIVTERCDYELFDIGFGYQGLGQFWAGRADSESSQAGLSVHNNPDEYDAQPRTHLTLSNFSVVSNEQGQTGVLLHQGAAGHLINGLVQGFVDGVDVDHFETTAHGELSMTHCAFFGNEEPFETGDDEGQLAFTTEEFFFEGTSGETFNLDSIQEIMQDPYGQSEFDLCVPGAPVYKQAFEGFVFNPALLDEAFESAEFYGPIDPQLADWTQGIWISFD